MARHLALLTVAVVLGGLGHHVLERCLAPQPAYAAEAGPALPAGMTARQLDGALVVTARDTTLTLAPDGQVTVRAPEKLIIGTADDVKIEGYHVKIEASSDVEVKGSKILLGGYNTDVKIADGDNPLALYDDEKIVKSERVKAR
jgi:hypothetical protein